MAPVHVALLAEILAAEDRIGRLSPAGRQYILADIAALSLPRMRDGRLAIGRHSSP